MSLLVAALLVGLFIVSCLLVSVLANAANYKDTHPHTREDLADARKDSLKQSHSTVTGKVSEHLAPLFPEFGETNLRNARFLGSPIDFIVFEGLDEGQDVNVKFIEIKTGNSQLTTRERRVRDAVKSGRIEWELVRLNKPVSRGYSDSDDSKPIG